MLIDRSILNLIELIELSFENHEISSCLSIQINDVALEFLYSVNNFEEVLMAQEELEILLIDFLNDL